MTSPPSSSIDLQRLTAVSRVMTDSDGVQDVLDITVSCACDLLHAERAVLLLKGPHGDALQLRAARGLAPSVTERLEGQFDERIFRRLARVLDDGGGYAVLAVPLLTCRKVVGILAVARTESAGPFDTRDEWLLSALADQAGVSLRRDWPAGEGPQASPLQGRDALQMVGHDLRSPLGALKGYVHLLKDGHFGEVSEPQAKVLGRVERITDHLTSLTRNIEDFGRLARGCLHVETHSVVLSEVVEEACAIVDLRARDRELDILRSVDPDDLHVVAEPDRLRQVVIQLLDNAVKHGPPGTNVEIRAREVGGGRVRVWVRDEGPGVPAESAELIFEPYRQIAPPPNAPNGLGLGLAIARALVEHMGGSLTLETDEGPGATFRIELNGAS